MPASGAIGAAGSEPGNLHRDTPTIPTIPTIPTNVDSGCCSVTLIRLVPRDPEASFLDPQTFGFASWTSRPFTGLQNEVLVRHAYLYFESWWPDICNYQANLKLGEYKIQKEKKRSQSSTLDPTILFCMAQIWILWLLTRFCKQQTIFDHQLCASMLGALCVGWVHIKFQAFHSGFQSYSGLIWFSRSLGDEKFLKLKGNIISDPPADIFSTCCECIMEFLEKK